MEVNPYLERIQYETWEWNFDKETNEYWQHIKSIVNFLIKRSDEGYFVGTPEFGSAGDILSLLRGPGELAIDLIEQKSKVKEAINIIANTWVELHEEIYKMTKNINDNGDILPWMSLWAPGRHDQIACDYSTLISPQLFKEFFVPEIKIEGDWCEYSTYHLDGPDAMKNHLETLLKIEEIDNIEWTPGIGMPPTLTPEYIPNYKKIQKMGKKLYLLVKPWEIESLLNDLSPKGLFIHTNVDSEDEANKLLKNIEKWSCK